MAHTFNPSTGETEACGSLSSGPAWSTKRNPLSGVVVLEAVRACFIGAGSLDFVTLSCLHGKHCVEEAGVIEGCTSTLTCFCELVDQALRQRWNLARAA